ncbi:solute carrier family 22 member 16-like [Amblyomma americanum]
MLLKTSTAINKTKHVSESLQQKEKIEAPAVLFNETGCAVGGSTVPATFAGLQDSVTKLLGHGPYQRRILWCGIIGSAAALLQYTSYQLIGRPVDHWCRPPVELGHLSADAWKNRSIPIEADGSFSKCTMFDPTMDDTGPGNRTIVRCHDWDYDIADNSDSIVSQFDLVCSREFLYPLSSLLSSLGYAILSPVAGFASDRVGRKPVTLFVAFLMFFGLISCSVARTFTSFLVNRVLIMAAANSAYLLTFILLYEGTGPTRRWCFLMLHTALVGTLVTPSVQIVALLRPRWILAHGLLITPAAMFVVSCFLL